MLRSTTTSTRIANQPGLHYDVALWFNDGFKTGFTEARVDFHETVDGDHGRIETHRHWVWSDNFLNNAITQKKPTT